MNEMFSVEGKVAVITGAAGVLGGSLARHFASQGADVVALVHRPEQVDSTLESLKSLGGNPCAYACNVMDKEVLNGIADEVVSKYGKIDILINVAGGNVPGATIMDDQNIWDMKLEDWEKVINLNLNGYGTGSKSNRIGEKYPCGSGLKLTLECNHYRLTFIFRM